jgi:hypothetical protein
MFFIIVMACCAITFLVTAFLKIDPNFGKKEEKEGDGATCHHDDEEHTVTYHILQISRNHARQHQSEIGDARTDGIMGGLELSLTVEQHVEGKNREAQTITQLLDKKTAGNHDEVAVERITQIDVNHIRQGDGANQRPEPFLHSIPAHQNTTKNSTQQQTYQSHSTVGKAIFLR